MLLFHILPCVVAILISISVCKILSLLADANKVTSIFNELINQHEAEKVYVQFMLRLKMPEIDGLESNEQDNHEHHCVLLMLRKSILAIRTSSTETAAPTLP